MTKLDGNSDPLLIFDLDGTLVDTAPDLIGTLNQMLQETGLQPIAPDALSGLIGRGARVMLERGFERNGMTPSATQIDRLFDAFIVTYESRIARHSRPYPGVMTALEKLGNLGWTFAVCTNKLEHLSRLLLDELSMTGHFPVICGADTFSVRKPDPGHLLQTIQLAGGRPENAIMIGDSHTDIATAKAAEIPVIAVDFGYTEAPVESYGPDLVVSHFDQLAGAVDQLHGSVAAG